MTEIEKAEIILKAALFDSGDDMKEFYAEQKDKAKQMINDVISNDSKDKNCIALTVLMHECLKKMEGFRQ